MDLQPLWGALLVIGVNALAAVLFIAVALGWKWLKQQDDYATVVTLVQAAEQMLAGQAGYLKYDWVMAQVRQLVPHLNEKLVRALIEAAVYEMNRGKGQ